MTRTAFGEALGNLLDGSDLTLPGVEVVDGIPTEALPTALAHLLALQARVVARMATGRSIKGGADRMLSIEDAAARSGMSRDWLYRNKAALPFIRRIGRRVVCSEAGLTRWLATRGR